MDEFRNSRAELQAARLQYRIARLRYLVSILEVELDLGREPRLGMAGMLKPDPTLSPGDKPYPFRLDEGAAITELATGEYR